MLDIARCEKAKVPENILLYNNSFSLEVTLDDGDIMILGGTPYGSAPFYYGSSTKPDVFMVNMTTGKIVPISLKPSGINKRAYFAGDKHNVTSMPRARYGHACGLVKDPNTGNSLVVVAGGVAMNKTSSASRRPFSTASVDVLDLSTMTWSEGADLPHPIFFGSAVPHGDTFAIVGGRSDPQYSYYTSYYYYSYYNYKEQALDTVVMYDASGDGSWNTLNG